MAWCFSGQQLRVARLAAGYSREHLAAEVGRSAESIRSYELGRALPSIGALTTLADTFGKDVGYFFEEVADAVA